MGNISVYQNDELIGSLEQNTLVEEYHDVLWNGPIHDLLVGHLRSYLAETPLPQPAAAQIESELLMRWINAICRMLMNIQRYRHGGGLLITTDSSLDGLNVKYKICYDRLLRSLRSMVENQTQCVEAAEQRAADFAASRACCPTRARRRPSTAS